MSTAKQVAANREHSAVQDIARRIRRLIREENGATAIEYGLIASGIALGLIPIMFSISGSLTAAYGLVPGWFALV
jgi:Flp pilus assembly pilin Flp